MGEFRVWAPGRRQVDVVLSGGPRVPMQPRDSGTGYGGWWACSVERAGPGSD